VLFLSPTLIALWTSGLPETYEEFLSGSWDLFIIFLAILIGAFFGNNRENGKEEEEEK